MALKLGTYRDYNYTRTDYWENYKLGVEVLDDVIDFAFKRLNLTLQFIEAENATNEWPELREKLIHQKIDLIAAQIVPNPNFDVNYTITSPFSTTFTAILSSDQASTSQPVYAVFFSLSTKAWLCVISHIVAVSIIRTLSEAKKKGNSRSLAQAFWAQIFNNWGSFLQKPQSHAPKTFISKFVFLLLLIEVVVVLAFYNGNFQAGYVITKSDAINTLDQLITTNARIAIPGMSPARNPIIYLSTHFEKYQAISNKISVIDSDDYDKLVDNGTMDKDILSGKCVVVDVVDNIIGYMVNSTQPFYLSKSKYFPVPVVFQTRKNISKILLNKINLRISRFVETQQRTPYERHIDLSIRKYADSAETVVDPLTLNDLEPIFLLLVTGHFLCTLTFIAERKRFKIC